MSHVVDMNIIINDLDALKDACKIMGTVELVKNKTTFKWFGQYVGDHPLPKGFKKEDMGHCDHVIRVKNNNRAYEIGVCKRRDGKKGYTLLWDFWAGGMGLQEAIGKDGNLLKQAYPIARSKKEMIKAGYKVKITKKKNGNLLMRAK